VTYRIVDAFGNAYIVEEAEFIETETFGRCLRGWYRLEAEDGVRRGPGDFRLDTARSVERLPDQLSMEAA
jgi:hypothetical protein